MACRARSFSHPQSLLLYAALFAALALGGCGDGGGGGDGDAGPRGDAGGQVDAGAPDDARVGDDGSVEGDGGASDDASIGNDGAVDAGSDGGIGCSCDVTSLCDTGCACDLACSITPGAPPLDLEAMMMQRGEIAVYWPSTAAGSIDRVTLHDDGYTGAGGPSPAFRTLSGPSPHAALAAPPLTLAADVDGDGRDEAILVTTTSVVVEDLAGTALAPRTVHTFAAATAIDAAAGDLTGDGVPDLVIARRATSTLTIELLSMGETGGATVLATATIANVARHAITIARPEAGMPSELFVLRAGTGSPGTLEALVRHRLTYTGSALVEGATLDLGGECLVESPVTAGDEGVAIAIGNVDADPASETVYAAYCGSQLEVSMFDPGLAYRLRWILPPDLDPNVVELRAFRPFLAIAQLGPLPSSTPKIVAGTNSSGGSSPEGAVTVLRPYLDRLQVFDSASFSSFASTGSVLTSMAVRDVDRDGVDEIVAGITTVQLTGGTPWDPCGTFCELAETGSVVELFQGHDLSMRTELESHAPGSTVGLGPGVALAVGDLDGDSIRVRSTGNVYLHTGRPFVNAVLAAPPTWLGRAGASHTGDSSTAFGTSMTTGTSDTRTINASASVTVSAGASFGVVEFSSSVTASFEFSSSTTLERSVSFGTETSVGADADLVLFRAVPYASYEYRVVSHPDASQVGSLMTIDVPGTMIETVRTLSAFRAEYGAEADAVIPAALLTHTIGDPSTYPTLGDCSDAALEARLGAGSVSEVAPSPSLVDVGSATSGARTQTMSIAMQTGTATEITLGVEMSVGVGAGGVSVEASAGIGTGTTHETTVGRDVSYTGAVGYMASGYGIDTRFEWGLCVFHYTSPQYGSYPVVGYVVRRY